MLLKSFKLSAPVSSYEAGAGYLSRERFKSFFFIPWGPLLSKDILFTQ